MPTYQDLAHKVTIEGTDFGGAEIWTTSFWLGLDGGGTFADPTQAEADAIATAWETFFTNSAHFFSTRHQTTAIKVSEVLANGTSDPARTVYHNYGTPISGAGGPGDMPPQVALAATLTSARARGYASKGRMYLPAPTVGVDATGHMITGTAAALATGLKTFFDAVNANNTLGLYAILNSAATVGVPSHSALQVRVTGIKVGNVYDTQRRRRNGLSEAYSASTLA